MVGVMLQVVGLVVASALLSAPAAYALPPAQSLARCQRLVVEEGQLFVTRVQQLVGRCLDAAADESLRRERPAVDGVARSCVNAFAEIRSSGAELGVEPR